jgi:ATP-dependent Clp protease ATP-binding subunit ClpA
VEDHLADMILEGTLSENATVRITVREGELSFAGSENE